MYVESDQMSLTLFYSIGTKIEVPTDSRALGRHSVLRS